MRYLLIDTDTASDDAIALIIAARQPDIQIEAITVVAGNVPVAYGVQNALYTLELCQKHIPVYQGAAKPLLRPLQTAQFVHGQDGMGDIGLPLRDRLPHPGNAIDVIINTIEAHPYELEIVTLGPLTNLAIALLKEPAIALKIKQCTIMGGIGTGHGNITPVSEFNIWVDPEAAQIVFSSGMNLRMVGWDISRNHAFFDDSDVAELRAIDTPLAHFSVDIQQTLYEFATKTSKLPGFDLPDPIAMAIALDPSIATVTKNANVEVILGDGSTRGQTVVDHNGLVHDKPTTEVVLEASREKFLAMLHKALR
ncbi:MAG: nucleoside hydrolase [Spirosomataceae bacterium]